MGLFDMFQKKSASKPVYTPPVYTPPGAPAADAYAFRGKPQDYFSALLENCFPSYELCRNVSPMGFSSQPTMKAEWVCSCGARNSSRFCAECGRPKPVSNEWTCSCGNHNRGQFCPECGQKKPYVTSSVSGGQQVNGTCAELTFVLRQNGAPKLGILLVPKHKYNNKAIRNTMEACQAAGIPCLRFMNEFRNSADYVISRVRHALG